MGDVTRCDLDRVQGRQAVGLCTELATQRACGRGLPGHYVPQQAAELSALQYRMVNGHQLPSYPGVGERAPSLTAYGQSDESSLWLASFVYIDDTADRQAAHRYEGRDRNVGSRVLRLVIVARWRVRLG